MAYFTIMVIMKAVPAESKVIELNQDFAPLSYRSYLGSTNYAMLGKYPTLVINHQGEAYDEVR